MGYSRTRRNGFFEDRTGSTGKPPRFFMKEWYHEPMSPTIFVKNQIYRHYKGHDYRVLTLAQMEATGEDVVVYKALHDESASKIWVRPLSSFTEPVTWPDGTIKPRFVLLDVPKES